MESRRVGRIIISHDRRRKVLLSLRMVQERVAMLAPRELSTDIPKQSSVFREYGEPLLLDT